MNEDLKPCPFCGGEAELQELGAHKGHFCVRCVKCWAKSIFSEEPTECIEAWNTRPAPSVESVEEWEKRTGRKYPDDGPVWINGWLYIYSKYDDPENSYVASPDHTKPEE